MKIVLIFFLCCSMLLNIFFFSQLQQFVFYKSIVDLDNASYKIKYDAMLVVQAHGPHPASRPAVVRMLMDPEPTLRSLAIECLLQSRSKSELATIEIMLQDPDGDVRAHAKRAVDLLNKLP